MYPRLQLSTRAAVWPGSPQHFRSHRGLSRMVSGHWVGRQVLLVGAYTACSGPARYRPLPAGSLTRITCDSAAGSPWPRNAAAAAICPRIIAGGATNLQLAQTLGDLAVRMQAQKDTADTPRAIVDAAAHIVPGARWAGISMIQGRQVVAQVPTDPIVAKLDELQNELGPAQRHCASTTRCT